MRNSILKIGVFSCFVLNTLPVLGAPTPPAPEHGAPAPVGVPIDGTVYLLFGIGLLYAFYYFKTIKIKKASE